MNRDTFGRMWCKHFHRAITMPFNGEYTCLTCQRRFPVPFAQASQTVAQRWAKAAENGYTLEESATMEARQ